MIENITVVTAFFKINRGNWKGFERTDHQYFEYFKVWGKLKNKLIAYVESKDLRDEILKFRASYGLENQTFVNLVPNCLEAEPELYKRMVDATENPIHKTFRLFPNNPEVWNGTYNYIMLMKTWCICDAIKKGQAEGSIAWIDFGYNHGGTAISPDSDFNFEWNYEFPQKMNLFTLHEMDNRPIFEMLFSMDTYLMGCAIVGYDKLWFEFWELLKSSANSLCDCGLCDDDQNIMLMAYRKKPEIFNIIPSEWTKMLYQFGGEQLNWIQDIDDRTAIVKACHKFIHNFKFKITCARYAIGVYKHMSKITVK